MGQTHILMKTFKPNADPKATEIYSTGFNTFAPSHSTCTKITSIVVNLSNLALRGKFCNTLKFSKIMVYKRDCILF